MCRLLGITGFEFARHENIVLNFCELARSGHVMPGDPPGHGDGWGMAFYRNGELAVHKSGGNLLEEAEEAMGMLRDLGETPVLILHLRKSAWKDTTCARHSHPFHYDRVAFAHNGVVYGYQGLIPGITVPDLRDDALDTEVFFLHVMSAQGLPLDRAFLRTVSLIKGEYRFSSLNSLFSDGERLFAYRDYSKEPEYYSLYKTRSKGSWIVSSEPLDPDFRWEMMEKEEFLVVP
jgi:glutamine amidotransferase